MMNTLELKGNFISLLAEVDDPNLLKKMLAFCLGLLRSENAVEDLAPETMAALEIAVAESYDESDLISNEDVMKKAAQWLRQ